MTLPAASPLDPGQSNDSIRHKRALAIGAIYILRAHLDRLRRAILDGDDGDAEFVLRQSTGLHDEMGEAVDAYLQALEGHGGHCLSVLPGALIDDHDDCEPVLWDAGVTRG